MSSMQCLAPGSSKMAYGQQWLVFPFAWHQYLDTLIGGSTRTFFLDSLFSVSFFSFSFAASVCFQEIVCLRIKTRSCASRSCARVWPFQHLLPVGPLLIDMGRGLQIEIGTDPVQRGKALLKSPEEWMILFAIPGGAAIRLKKRTLGVLTSSVLSACHSWGSGFLPRQGQFYNVSIGWFSPLSYSFRLSCRIIMGTTRCVLQPCQCFLISGEFIRPPYTSSLPVAFRFV